VSEIGYPAVLLHLDDVSGYVELGRQLPRGGLAAQVRAASGRRAPASLMTASDMCTWDADGRALIRHRPGDATAGSTGGNRWRNL